MHLSVIIVAYNEEKNIKSCIASIFKLLDQSNLDFEVILVDSCSEDKTLEIVRKYDVKILSLLNFRSPSTAKYIGFINSTGDALLFLDGDMELIMDKEDLENCLNNVNNRGYAGVQGSLEDFINGSRFQTLRKVSNLVDVDYLPGSAFYSREALESQVFNPNLNSNEERELGYRLKKSGYKMAILPFDMVKHKRRNNLGGFSEIKRRYSNNYYLGLGQVFRSNLFSYLLFKHMIDQMVPFLFFLSFLGFITSFYFSLFEIANAIALIHFMAIFYYLGRYLSLSRYIDKYVYLWGIIYGFLTYKIIKIEYEMV